MIVGTLWEGDSANGRVSGGEGTGSVGRSFVVDEHHAMALDCVSYFDNQPAIERN
jgi:hypothetical protein